MCRRRRFGDLILPHPPPSLGSWVVIRVVSRILCSKTTTTAVRRYPPHPYFVQGWACRPDWTRTDHCENVQEYLTSYSDKEWSSSMDFVVLDL